ncbi:hypothetical protein LTR53_006239 [Teratosphaeriaceae sp. CCFEE 6253]|nr:hypothetical protein LTR53_006239 [Teratosphaeriaceae sp. CCFEE 6253]
MSSNGDPPPTSRSGSATALGVSFTKLTDRSHGESSSQAGSRSSRSTRGSDGRGGSGSRDDQSQDTLHSRDSPEHPINRLSRRPRTSGGFLLDSGRMNGSPRASDLPHRNGKRKAQNGFLQVEKRRNLASRVSIDSSLGGSPLSREMSGDGPGPEVQDRPTTARPPAIDPAQLVQMALELSEGRRRHVSVPLHLPLPARSDIRRSSGLRPTDAVRQVSRQRQRAGYTSSNEPLRNVSDRYSLGAAQDGYRDDDESKGGDGVVPDDVPHTFTPATLSRASRARKYFELASEHRRLLLHLPPLKPDADAPGNHTFMAMNSPGSTHPQISRVPSHLNNKHSLGRSYNPLQSLRNRRLRNRERQVLPAPPETWQDTESIRSWIDDVEAATGLDDYRASQDRVELPVYAGDDGGTADAREAAKGHRRTDTVSSVITRPENARSVEPSELLADAYWTEKGYHKELLENRHGSPIFHRPRRSKDTARTSVDIPQAIGEADEVPFHKRAHRVPHILPRRHGILPRSESTSSASTEGGHRATLDGDGDFENTGPLEKHMEQLIAQYEKGEPKSPELVSPDHWDSKNTAFPAAHAQRSRRDTRSHENGRLSVDTAQHHRRAKSADGRVNSIDRELAGNRMTEPDSPAVPGFRSSLDLDRSTEPPQHGAFARQRSKLHRLPFVRSRSKERNGTDRLDFAETPIDAYSNEARPRASQESARPPFIQRHRTTDSVASSIQRQGTTLSAGSVKEGGSTVGRLLKGGRLGELVRGEGSRLSDRFRGKEKPDDVALETASEGSESDREANAQRRPFDDEEPSPRTSVDLTRSKPKYFLPNLPTFRSPMARGTGSTPASVDSDPIARQQRAQKEAGRSLRFDKLAPPRINLPVEEDEQSTYRSDAYVGEERRKSYGFLGSNGSQLSIGEPKGVARPKPQGRHWSISDKLHPQPEQISKISSRDVARVRALLLSSGVKAREIHRRANGLQESLQPPYATISDTVGKDFPAVPLRARHVVASRLLSDHLSSTLTDFELAPTHFHDGPAKDLNSRLEALGRKAADQLTTTVHSASDDADAFIVELTTKTPQDIKRVDDAVDAILRERRRQFRLLRRAGFKLLEWLVLGIMWWVWFVVVLFNTSRRILAGSVAFLKWLFWL